MRSQMDTNLLVYHYGNQAVLKFQELLLATYQLSINVIGESPQILVFDPLDQQKSQIGNF